MAAEPGPQLPAGPYGHVRAAHADRERAIDVLKAAFAEGRLDMDEYADRVGRAQTSRTYGELGELTADLPVGPLGTLPSGLPGTPPAGYQLVPVQSVPVEPASVQLVPARSAAALVPAAQRRETSGLALVSILAGLASFIFPVMFLAVPAAMAFGLMALAATGRGRKRGRMLAFTGIALSLYGLWRLRLGG
jgi:hypothetical protein